MDVLAISTGDGALGVTGAIEAGRGDASDLAKPGRRTGQDQYDLIAVWIV